MKLTALFSGNFSYAVPYHPMNNEYSRSKTSHSKICIFFSTIANIKMKIKAQQMTFRQDIIKI